MSAGKIPLLTRLSVAFLGLIVLGAGGCGGGGSSGGPRVPDMPEIPIVPADDHGDTRADATVLPLVGSVSGVIEGEGAIETGDDVDVFRVDVTLSGTLTVSTTGSLDTLGVLQGSDGTRLASDDDAGPGTNFEIAHTVGPGTYYIRVTSVGTHTGSYTLMVRMAGAPPPPPADDHGDTRADATVLPVGGSVTGEIEVGDDVDVFRVDAAQAGTLTISTTGSLDTEGVLQESDGTQLATDDDTGTGRNFQITHVVTAGTYYVEVAGYRGNTGSYTVAAELDVPPPPPSDDHGDTRATATVLAVGGSAAGAIETGNDVDVFRVDVAQAGTLTISTTGSLDTAGLLQGSDGTQLATDDDTGTGRNFRIVHAVTAGTYYVEVASYGANTGSYTVSANLQADEGDTIGAALPVTVGGSVPGRINRPGDVDYFRFQAAQSGTLAVWTSGEVATNLVLLDTSGKPLSTAAASSSGGTGLLPLSAGSPDVLPTTSVPTEQNIVSRQAAVRAGSTVIARVAERSGVGNYMLGSRNVRTGVTNVIAGLPAISISAGQRQQVNLAAHFDTSQARGELTFSASIQRPVVVGGVPLGVAITLSGSVMTIITQESGPAYSGTVGIEVSVSDPFGLLGKKVLNVQFTRVSSQPPAADPENCVTVQVLHPDPTFPNEPECARAVFANSCSYRVAVHYDWVRPDRSPGEYRAENILNGNETDSSGNGCLVPPSGLRYCVSAFHTGDSFRCTENDSAWRTVSVPHP